MENKDVISASNLSIGYYTKGRKTTVQSNLDFSLKGGNLTCLLGPNGAGKSTLLRTVSASQRGTVAHHRTCTDGKDFCRSIDCTAACCPGTPTSHRFLRTIVSIR